MRLKKCWAIIIIILLFSIACIIIYKNIDNNSDNNSNLNEPKVTNEKPSKKTIDFTFVGDLLFESPFYKAVDRGYDKDIYFNRVKKYFLDDDISIGNMEVVIGNKYLPVSGDGYNFCAPSYVGDLVSTLDFEVLSTSNNHSNDRGIDGLNSTIDFFKENTDILTVGTYKDDVDRETPRIIDIDGTKVGFLSYTLGTNVKVDKENRHMFGLYRDPDNAKFTDEYKEILTKEITTLRNNSDVLVVIMHWGTEFTFNQNKEQTNMANFLNSLGVDIIVGSHSHSMEPIEIIGSDHKTLVYYSLGNFVSHDDDIARTPKGQETFDNAYQIGLLSKLTLTIEDEKLDFSNIETIPIINYFDKSLDNFELIPFEDYDETYEKNHFRYDLGLTREFITNTFDKVIKKEYQKKSQ